jgi:molybdenum cofactor cytidylyltransferase
MNRVAAVVLAAGGSRRFGSPKQLHRVGERSLVRRAAEEPVEAGCDPVVVVLGAASAQVARELEHGPARLVFNPAWEDGMSSSIRAGIAALREAAPDCTAVILCLADQTRVTAKLLRRLAERLAAGPEPAVACRYEGVLGPPAIFSAPLFGRLEELSGDEGARRLLRSGEVPVAEINFPGGALDIDRPPCG